MASPCGRRDGFNGPAPLPNSDLRPGVALKAPSSLNGGTSVSHGSVSPWGGLDPLFGHSQGIAFRAFVNRDSLHPPPDLHPGKLFRRLMVGEGGGGRSRREEQGPARRNNRKEEEED